MSTGVATLMASGLLGGANMFGPYGALAILLAVTWILTEQLGLSPMPFVMAAIPVFFPFS